MDNTIVVVVKAIIMNNSKILVVKRANNEAVGAGEWELAGGKIDFGEQLEEALIREVNEETGIDIEVKKLMYATTLLTNPNRQIVILTYMCRTNQDDIHLSNEHTDYLWATKSELECLLSASMLEHFEKYKIYEYINV